MASYQIVFLSILLIVVATESGLEYTIDNTKEAFENYHSLAYFAAATLISSSLESLYEVGLVEDPTYNYGLRYLVVNSDVSFRIGANFWSLVSSLGLSCIAPRDASSSVEIMNFKELIFNTGLNRHLKPYMKLIVLFSTPDSSQTVQVEAPLFAPPKNPADKEHAVKNNVMILNSRILVTPRQSVFETTANIKLLEEVVKRAAFEKCQRTGKGTISVYSTGPVILHKLEFTAILKQKYD